MNDRSSINYISNAIDELIAILGIKEEPSCPELVTLLRKGNIQQCVKNIARHLGLQLDINLSYVSEDYRSNNVEKFRSHGLAKTDNEGRGVESITAQVLIPENLPIYGSPRIIDFPITVKIGENCPREPKTFITVMAHELSHVLLHSIRHPQKDNEVYADLTPMVLGFSRIISEGSIVVETTTKDNSIEKYTATYGYLSDSEFRFARNKIDHIRRDHLLNKAKLLDQITRIGEKYSSSKKNLFRFMRFLEYIDEHRREAIREQDAREIVQFHSPGYTHELKSAIMDSEEILLEAQKFYIDLVHYTKRTIERLDSYRKRIEVLTNRLDNKSQIIHENIMVLRRYVSIIHRMKIALLIRKQMNWI